MWLIKRVNGDVERVILSKASYTEEINGENTLSIVTTTKMNKYDSVIFKNLVGEWVEYVVQGVNQSRESLEVYLENSIYELHSFIIRDKRPDTQQSVDILGTILEGTRWTAGTSDIGGLFSDSYYHISAYEALKELIKLIGAEVEYKIVVEENKVISRTVNLKSRLGADKGRIFTYSKDMNGVSKSINDEVVTALIGRGKGEQISEDGYGRRITLEEVDELDCPFGVDYVSNTEALEAFGIYTESGYLHRFAEIVFDEITDVQELYLETKKVLDIRSQPIFTYEVPVILLDKPEDGVELGDTVYLIDPDFCGEKLVLSGRILKIKHDVLNPENSEVVLSNIVDDMAGIQKRIDSQVSDFRSRAGIWDRANAFNINNELPASYITQLLDAWNNAANASGGYTYTIDGQGTVTYNRPIDEAPDQVVQIVGGTMRIANSKTAEGEWEWKTVISADGIAGQEIISGSITTNHLSSDVGANLNLSSNESIVSTVSAYGTLNESYGLYVTQATQTANAFENSIGFLETSYTEVDGRITATTQFIETIIRDTAQGIVIGKTDSAFKIVISNQQISFWENYPEDGVIDEDDNPVAFINNQTLNIMDGAFFTNLQIGAFLWTVELDGSVSFGKVGA